MTAFSEIDPSWNIQSDGHKRWPMIAMSLGDAMLAGLRVEGPFAPDVPFPEDWDRAVAVFDDVVVRGKSNVAQATGLGENGLNPYLDRVMARYGAKTLAQAVSGLVNDGQAPFEIGERHLSVKPDEMWDTILGRGVMGGGSIRLRELSLSPQDFLRHWNGMQEAFGCGPDMAALVRSAYVFGLREPLPANDQAVLIGNGATVLTLPPRPRPNIPQRAREAIMWRSWGHSNKETGRNLSLSEDTVKVHLHRLYDLLGAGDAAGAFTRCVILGAIACERQTPLSKKLGRREYQALLGAALGKTNAEIGTGLSVSEGTVKGYLKRAFSKLGAEDRVHGARRAFQTGLVVVGRPPRRRASASF
jgi:DNA-binding NarL/FixJ family response regulator